MWFQGIWKASRSEKNIGMGEGGKAGLYYHRNKKKIGSKSSPIGYLELKTNFSLWVWFWYIGFTSRTLMSRNHSWKPSAETSEIPGGRLPCTYRTKSVPYLLSLAMKILLDRPFATPSPIAWLRKPCLTDAYGSGAAVGVILSIVVCKWVYMYATKRVRDAIEGRQGLVEPGFVVSRDKVDDDSARSRWRVDFDCWNSLYWHRRGGQPTFEAYR